MMVKTHSVGVAINLGLLMAFLPLPTLGQTLSQLSGDRRAIEFPDTDAYQTLVVDLHTHSVFSDGNVWPSIRMREAALDGLDAIAVTEHLEWQPHLEDIPHPDRNRSFEVALASLPEGSELMVIAGSEITRSAPVGHMNAVFIQDANALFEVRSNVSEPFDAREYYRLAGAWLAQAAVDAANDQGAFVFWNHSWSFSPDSKTVVTEFQRNNAVGGKLHGIEVVNGGTYSAESFEVALDLDLALIGVSDVHNLIDWDYQPHAGGHRPVNLVFAEGRSVNALREALFARRTVVWYKNLLIGRPRDLSPLLDASLKAVSARYIPKGKEETRVLTVVLQNLSDAHFQLDSLSDLSLVRNHDLIEIGPHSETTLNVRTGEELDRLTLDFEVLNALTAPKSHPVISFDLTID